MTGQVHAVVQNTKYVDQLTVACCRNSEDNKMAAFSSFARNVQNVNAFPDVISAFGASDCRPRRKITERSRKGSSVSLGLP